MIRLRDSLVSGNGYKVRLLLTQLGLPFERVEYDLAKGETRTPEFLQNINSNGRVPVLETEEGLCLPESGAILFFLAEGTPYLPSGRFEKARVLRWMFFEQYSHEPYVAVPRAWVHFGVEMTEERTKVLEEKRRLGYAALEVMEEHLSENDFFAANRYTIADIALYAYTHVAGEGSFDLSRFPAIGAWMELVRAQPRHVPITQG